MKNTHKIETKGEPYAPAVALNGEYTKLHSDVCIRESCKCLSFSSSENLSNLSIGKTLGHSADQSAAVNLASNGVKVEAVRAGFRLARDNRTERLPIARRTSVTGTEYTVTYLEYKGNQMDKPMKAAFAFFKGVPHSTEVARYKLIAQNLGLTVNSGVAKTVAGAKYLPHSGKKEEQRRARQDAAKRMKDAAALGVTGLKHDAIFLDEDKLFPTRPTSIIFDDVVPITGDSAIGNDQSNLQSIGSDKEDKSKDSN